MLVEYSDVRAIALPCGPAPIREGHFVTVKGGSVVELTPGNPIKGLAGCSYDPNQVSFLEQLSGNIGNINIPVYFKGELGTDRFVMCQDYGALDVLYVNQDCLLTNKRTPGCSSRIGRAVGIEPAVGQVLLRFWLDELPLLPPASKAKIKDRTRWEIIADREVKPGAGTNKEVT